MCTAGRLTSPLIFAGPRTVQTMVLYHSVVLCCQEQHTTNLPACVAPMPVNLHLHGCKFTQYLGNCSVARDGYWKMRQETSAGPSANQTETQRKFCSVVFAADSTALKPSSWIPLSSTLCNKPPGTSFWTFGLMRWQDNWGMYQGFYESRQPRKAGVATLSSPSAFLIEMQSPPRVIRTVIPHLSPSCALCSQTGSHCCPPPPGHCKWRMVSSSVFSM